MPLGTGADQMQNVPMTGFTPNPAAFDVGTSKNHQHAAVLPTPGPGLPAYRALPKSGILTWAKVTFEGSLTVALNGGTCTTRWPWPYGLLDMLSFTANTNNGLINVTGVDLHVHRFARNPSFIDATDNFTGTLGGGNALTSATYQLSLTWDVPICADLVTQAGAIFAQSSQNDIALGFTQATTAALFTLTGGATATIAGNWTYNVESYDIPVDKEAGMVVPDLTRLHGMQSKDTGFLAAGDVNVPLTQTNGQLLRLFVQVRGTNDAWLSPRRTTATPPLDSIRLEYGSNQKPLDIKTNVLLAINNEHYGAPLPYGYLCLDFVKTSPIRDAVYMPGLTELRVVPVVTSGATLDANAKVHTMQETLFQ